MNRVDFSCEGIAEPAWLGAAEGYLAAAMDSAGAVNWDLSVLLCGDDAIRALNRDYRGKDEATDVLSFPLGETYPEDGVERYSAGDIVVSLETLAANSEYFGVTPNEELKRLFMHGIMHLSGMDHETNDEGEPMLIHQEGLLKLFSEVVLL